MVRLFHITFRCWRKKKAKKFSSRDGNSSKNAPRGIASLMDLELGFVEETYLRGNDSDGRSM